MATGSTAIVNAAFPMVTLGLAAACAALETESHGVRCWASQSSVPVAVVGANPMWSILELHVSAESQHILGTLQELLQAHYLTAQPGVVVEIDHDCLRAQLKILVRRCYLSS